LKDRPLDSTIGGIMNQQELSQKLSPVSGLLTIARDSFGDSFGDSFRAFLDLYYGGLSITISGATLSTDAQPDGAIVYTGKSSFLNVADLPVTAYFNVDASGTPSVELRYTLRGALAEANS